MREAGARRRAARSRYDGSWRDRDPAEAPAGVAPVIRLKAPQSGETVDRGPRAGRGHGRQRRSSTTSSSCARDGTPTYKLSVVVDDHDMAITHVIRGDDHLTNAFRQTQIYRRDGLGRCRNSRISR